MFVGVARLTLQIPESGSLKAKRQVLRRVTDRLKARFNVAVAEVGDNELWQKAVLGLTVVGNERRHVDEMLEKLVHAVEEMYVAPLLQRETEILPFGDALWGRGTGAPGGPAGRRARRDDDGDDTDGDAPPGARGDLGDEAEGLTPEELLAALGRADRSMAEAEGMGDFSRRHDGGRPSQAPGASTTSPPSRGSRRDLTLDEARARARALRNPRDWEKE